MLDFTLKALNFGVLGLCAVMVLMAARLLYNEQKREGDGRTILLRSLSAFLLFCLLIAGLNAYVQLNQQPKPMLTDEEAKQLVDKNGKLQERLRLAGSKLDEIERALADKEYVELRSLAAATEPATRERLKRTIDGLRERMKDLRASLQDE